jgi:hypothetical protein
VTRRLPAFAGPSLILGAALSGFAGPAAAAGLEVKVEIPRLAVAEYHRPYVAIWIEGEGQPARTLAVWYDSDNREEAGRKWLADLRQWWRKSGRNLTLPADGLSGATRAPGVQAVSFSGAHPALKNLPAGQYQLAVEAAREVGGQEVVKTAFQWPPAKPLTASAKGSRELGAITVTTKP